MTDSFGSLVMEFLEEWDYWQADVNAYDRVAAVVERLRARLALLIDCDLSVPNALLPVTRPGPVVDLRDLIRRVATDLDENFLAEIRALAPEAPSEET